MLWEYKQKFSKDKKFERAAKEKFCVVDLKLVSGETDYNYLVFWHVLYMYCTSANDQITDFYSPSFCIWLFFLATKV